MNVLQALCEPGQLLTEVTVVPLKQVKDYTSRKIKTEAQKSQLKNIIKDATWQAPVPTPVLHQVHAWLATPLV